MKCFKLKFVTVLLALTCVFLVGCKGSVFLSEEMTVFEVLDEKPVLTREVEEEILGDYSDLIAHCQPYQLTEEQKEIIEELIERAVFFSEFNYEFPDKFLEENVFNYLLSSHLGLDINGISFEDLSEDELAELGLDEEELGISIMVYAIMAENYALDSRILTDLKFKSSFEVQLGEQLFQDDDGVVYVAAISSMYLENVENADLSKYAQEIVEDGEDATADDILRLEKELNQGRDFYLQNKGKWLLTQKDLLYFNFDLEETNLWTTEAIMPGDAEDDFFVDEPASGDEIIEEIIIHPGRVEIVMTIGSEDLFVNNAPKKMDVAPFVEGGRTMVPIRFVSENLGAKIDWEQEKSRVTIKDNGTTLVMHIDSPVLLVNDKEILMDTAPVVQEGRTFVPVRFVSENLGAKVQWDEITSKVIISK